MAKTECLFWAYKTHAKLETQMEAPPVDSTNYNQLLQKCLHFAEACTLIFVSERNGGSGLSRALVPAQGSKRWSFGRLLLLPVTEKGLFFGTLFHAILMTLL